MARFCPQCGEIHFETSTTPLPSNCRKCDANMNEASGLLPRLVSEEAATPPPADAGTTPPPPKPKGKRPDGLKGIVVGSVVTAVAVTMIVLGYGWNTGAKEATAEVYAGAADAPKGYSRDRLTARYSVGNKTYYMYPGLRRERETFTVYYLPDDPATGYEMRPFFTLMIGGKVLLIGLSILAFGVVKLMVWRARIADFQRTMAHAGG